MGELYRKFILKYSKTVGDRNEIDEMSTAALILQRAFGQQVIDPDWTWRKYSIHQILIICLFVYVFFGTLECLKSTDDVEIITEACYTLIMSGMFPLKMFIFINNRMILRSLYLTAKTTLLDFIKSDRSVKVDNELKSGTKIVRILFSMVLVPCSIYELATLWSYLNGRRILLSRSTSTLMPMTTPYYEIAWFLHTIFLFEISSTIILDMWFVLLIYLLCVASDSLVKVLKVKEKEANESQQSYAKRLNRSLKTFYKYHLIQIEYLKQLSSMYKWLAFVPLCNAAMCICLILLVMSKEINWKFAPHTLPMFAEIFAYNWYGEQIKTKAYQLYLALLDFDWTNLSLKDRKSYYIIITYMRKEFGIKTAVGYDLSLITMTAVLKVSYQAFTVLQTLDA